MQRKLSFADHTALFQAIRDRATKELTPKLRVGPKSNFWIHAFINAILNLVYPKDQQNAYFDRYTTTLGYTVAMAARHGGASKVFRDWRILCHEIQHVVQAQRRTRVLFGFLYLWPVSQGILLALLGWIPVFWVPGWEKLLYLAGWLLLSGLHFIPHWPDPWRTRWELEAYAISMHLYHKEHREIPASYINGIVKNFTSMMYFMMEPRKDLITYKIYRIAAEIRRGESPVKDEPIVKIAEEEYDRLAT